MLDRRSCRIGLTLKMRRVRQRRGTFRRSWRPKHRTRSAERQLILTACHCRCSKAEWSMSRGALAQIFLSCGCDSVTWAAFCSGACKSHFAVRPARSSIVPLTEYLPHAYCWESCVSLLKVGVKPRKNVRLLLSVDAKYGPRGSSDDQ